MIALSFLEESAMDPVELYNMVHKRPFEPFRVYVSDGRVYEIIHPEINMVGVRWILIGVLEPGDTDPDPIPDHHEKVLLSMITKVEPLLPTRSASGTQEK
jgi:hypothetical protein